MLIPLGVGNIIQLTSTFSWLSKSFSSRKYHLYRWSTPRMSWYRMKLGTFLTPLSPFSTSISIDATASSPIWVNSNMVEAMPSVPV